MKKFLIIFFILFLSPVFAIDFSIPMPTIIGEFNINYPWIDIYGIENIIDDNIGTLNINETTCNLDRKYMECEENRVVIMGLGGQITIMPKHKEYKIKFVNKNKIIFEEKFPTHLETTGEIDLNAKTLIYTVKNAGFNMNETRKIEIVTDNDKIEKLEKKIIKKSIQN